MANLNSKFNEIYFDLKFRDKVFLTIFPLPFMRFILRSILSKKKPLTETYKIKIIILLFIIQVVFIIPILLYNLYINYYILQKLFVQNKRKFKSVSRIGIHSPWFNKFAGGGEKVAAHIAEYFENKFPDASIEVICDDWDNTKIIPPVDIKDINHKYGTNLKRTFVVNRNHNFNSLLYFNYELNLMKTSSEYDIFVNCFMSLLPSIAAINFHYVHFPYNFDERKSDKLFELYLKSYDCFITNSDYTDGWTKKYLKVDNTRRIYPSVIVRKFDKIPNKSKMILSVGRLSPEKCFESQIDAFQNNSNKFEGFELHIVGALHPDNDEYFGSLKHRAQNKNIKFFSNLSYSELNSKYENAMFYWHSMGYGNDKNALPLVFEHFGITLVEAISCGAVPIVLNVGGPAEIVNNGNCGYVWNTLEELAGKTSELLNNPELLKSFQEKSIIAAQKYNLDKFEEEFDKLINETISKYK
jgi:glycosyltransferase involved in cell wall biosynthesis